MIEQTLESKIIEQLQALLPAALMVGFWQPEEEGDDVKHQPPLISIICNLGSADTEGLPMYTSSVSTRILTPCGSDSRRVKMIEWVSAVNGYYRSLNGNFEAMKTDLSEDGVYTVRGIKLDQADSGFDTVTRSLYTDIPIQVSFHTC